ncbi:MAG: aminotransferase class V-fold PLP-dependent enzyme [Polyangia bacterium]
MSSNGETSRAIVLADARSSEPVDGAGRCRALAEVGGLPLLARNLRTLRSAGVESAAVVTGYRADEVRRAIEETHHGLDVSVVHNPQWERGGAHSLVAAAKFVGTRTILVSSDHLYPPSLLRRLLASPVPVDSVLIPVDRRLDEVFDPDQCLRVDLEGDTATDLGRELRGADGVCPGVVRISPKLVCTLRRLLQEVEVDVYDALRAMARRGRVHTLDVATERWISISSPQARRYAELLLQLHGDTLETSSVGGPAVLLNPGPVGTTPRVKAAVGARDMCHREPVFTELLDSVQRKLGTVFGATEDHDVLVLTASGTGGMEAAITTFAPRDAKLLVLRNGAFGERLAEIASFLEIETEQIALEWGEPLPLERIERTLEKRSDISAVAMIHHETSVGILNPVAGVGALTRKLGRLLIVDAVSSLGSEDLDVERDRIDVCVTSANKCLHAFSGLASICVRRAAWETIAGQPPRGYYFDLRRYRDFMQRRRQTPFTPAVNTMLSLNAALDELLEPGLEERRQRYRDLSARIRSGLERLGLELVLDRERASHSLTIVRVPEDLSYEQIYGGLKERGFIVYESKGPLAGRTFQVANMGALEETQVDAFLAALADVLASARRGSGIFEATS